MTINGSSRYATTNAFRRALEDRLKRGAKIRGRSLEELRREFLFQRFLALVFSGPDGGWVLKGGASLLLRLAGARFSKDLDLLHVGESSADEAIAELRALASPRSGDHLTFVLEDGVSYSGTNPVVKISVAAYIGARYGGFPIDLALGLHFLGAPERIKPAPVVDVPGLTELPEVVVYPLADQVADKVCAMYELYGDAQSPSTRYRDLVDLALIVSSCELEADAVLRSLRSESRRRQMHLHAVGVPRTSVVRGIPGIRPSGQDRPGPPQHGDRASARGRMPQSAAGRLMRPGPLGARNRLVGP